MIPPKKYRSITVAIALLIISLSILSYSAVRLSETGLLRKMVLEIAAPVEDAINRSLKGLHDTWNRYLFLVGKEDESRRLRRENAVLNDLLNSYREGYLEGMRLRKLLDIKDGLHRKTVAARVIDNDRASLFKTVLIDKGTTEGLRVGLPVLSDQGVVGRIIETSWHASRVLLLIDENSNIDALIQRSGRGGMQSEIHLACGKYPDRRCRALLRPGRGVSQRLAPRRRHGYLWCGRGPLSEDRCGIRRRFR
jgi:rod shape-determining protein MreC